MKKTNFAFFSLAKRLLLPIGVFCFLMISATNVSAQSFKSPTDASIAVKEAIHATSQLLPSPGTQFNEVTKQAALDVRILNMFLDTVHDLNSTEAAYNAVTQKLESSQANATVVTISYKGGFDTAMQKLYQTITQ